MISRVGIVCLVLLAASLANAQTPAPHTAAPIRPDDLPEHLRPTAKVEKNYVPPRTPWGDPQIAGAYTNSDESGIPFERPAEFAGRRLQDISREELVVETTNFTDKTAYRDSSQYLTMTERFRPVGPNTIEWSVNFGDPHTWVRPWTFGMNLTRVPDNQGPFEYACNEGNYGLRDILMGARADDNAARTAAPEDDGER